MKGITRMEMYVKHRTFGLGKVVKLDDNFIEVYFGNQKKLSSFHRHSVNF